MNRIEYDNKNGEDKTTARKSTTIVCAWFSICFSVGNSFALNFNWFNLSKAFGTMSHGKRSRNVDKWERHRFLCCHCFSIGLEISLGFLTK